VSARLGGASAVEALQMKRVLVVDDEEAIRLTLAEALEDEGYAVVTAQNGAEALVQVRARPPHGIVLDLMMPVLDGWGFLKAYRAEELCAGIPVGDVGPPQADGGCAARVAG
jgi:CheY-like chemotaxis protein